MKPRLLAIAVMTALSFCFNALASAQTVSKTFTSETLKSVLEEVQAQTGYTFMYNYADVDLNRKITATFRNSSLSEVLDKVLDANLKYSVNGKIVAITKAEPQASKTSPKKAVKVSGTVISSSDNQPLIGAAVLVDGSTEGTITDIDGNFTISIPADAQVISFSCLGYQTKEIMAKDHVLMKLVSLSEEVNQLADAVVVGFGVQKKESVVGAVQAIKPSELTYPSSNLTTSFAGKIAGVISTQKSGEPGADGANFWIRGISTFGSNTSPLIVMDGVEINSTMLNSIAPETIESFSVLKDATATALYGSRGANGVMIITTKNGRDSDKININVRVETGCSMPTSVQEIADGVTYMNLLLSAKTF